MEESECHPDSGSKRIHYGQVAIDRYAPIGNLLLQQLLQVSGGGDPGIEFRRLDGRNVTSVDGNGRSNGLHRSLLATRQGLGDEVQGHVEAHDSHHNLERQQIRIKVCPADRGKFTKRSIPARREEEPCEWHPQFHRWEEERDVHPFFGQTAWQQWGLPS